MKDNIIKFLKSKDFRFVEELGRGACGKTVKLYDEIIDETFVCKKYEPFADALKDELFDNFIQEIKLLYLLNHKNIVRVFNYYIYPEYKTGYILMEYVEGRDIETFLIDNPQKINDIFSQCVSGFLHLERSRILHRDIRPMNILVSDDAELKIIDFGFGKRANKTKDYDKSITLNWWCEPPSDFNTKVYDFKTEVYFVGKLFEKTIRERGIETFKYSGILTKMCAQSPSDRIESFAEISRALSEDRFFEIEFNEYELEIYRDFSRSIGNSVSRIESDCKYYTDSDSIQKKLEDCYRSVMLEEYVPSNNMVIRCFLNGTYYFNKSSYFSVSAIKVFIELLRSCSKDKKNIIIDNLFARLDSLERYSNQGPDFDDEIPF